MKKIHDIPRFALAAGALLVIACYFLPLWEIKLWAPQYPEGLGILIWHNTLTGDVDVINGLNHYIGMKHLKAEMFPEFAFLRYVIAGFIAFTLFIAWKGNIRWLTIYCVVILIGACIAMADFYRWGYDYGHNLSSDAPIKVPGMAYQPPLLGYKVLLNFTALSLPAAGGWIIVGLGVLAFVILGFEWIPVIRKRTGAALVTACAITLLLPSCGKVIPVINFGADDCDYCKMKIMDKKFGAMIETDKGRWYKFDDMRCKDAFLGEQETKTKSTYVVAYDKPGELVVQETAFFKRGEGIRSPMGSGIAAFSNSWGCAATQLEGNCMSYTELYTN